MTDGSGADLPRELVVGLVVSMATIAASGWKSSAESAGADPDAVLAALQEFALDAAG